MGYIGVRTYLLTFDPNFLGHPSRPFEKNTSLFFCMSPFPTFDPPEVSTPAKVPEVAVRKHFRYGYNEDLKARRRHGEGKDGWRMMAWTQRCLFNMAVPLGKTRD